MRLIPFPLVGYTEILRYLFEELIRELAIGLVRILSIEIEKSTAETDVRYLAFVVSRGRPDRYAGLRIAQLDREQGGDIDLHSHRGNTKNAMEIGRWLR